jgi:hypothetical protein
VGLQTASRKVHPVRAYMVHCLCAHARPGRPVPFGVSMSAGTEARAGARGQRQVSAPSQWKVQAIATRLIMCLSPSHAQLMLGACMLTPKRSFRSVSLVLHRNRLGLVVPLAAWSTRFMDITATITTPLHFGGAKTQEEIMAMMGGE